MSTASTESASESSKPAALNRYPWYSPRIWHGMRAGDYFGMFNRNRWQIHARRLHIALAIAPVSLINSTLYRLQNLFYGRRLRSVKIEHPPLFIVGHWRSGTTHLHELLVRDPQFTFPTTFECFAPNNFLVTDSWAPYIFVLFMPKQRPMDNMAVGLNRPQEDEFALCAMGAPTPYNRMAFPNRPQLENDLLNADTASAEDLANFTEKLQRFVRTITFRRNKTIVLKSPPHTGRVGVLAETFPGAKFIHIARDPYDISFHPEIVVPRWMRRKAFRSPATKASTSTFLTASSGCMPALNGNDNRFPPGIWLMCAADLIADPLGQLARLYKELNLGDFESVRPEVERYLAGQRDYQPNRHELPEDLKAAIDRRWAGYRQKYGYL